MRIGIDVTVAIGSEPRGVAYHIISLLSALARLDTENEYLLYYRRDLWGRANDELPLPKTGNFHPRPIRFPKGGVDRHPRVWWQYCLPWVVKRDRVDVFHGPNHFVPALGSSKSIVTIHDVAYFKMQLYTPEFTKALKEWTLRCLGWAHRVIAISQHTWADLEQLGVAPERLRLIYGGGNIISEQQIAYARIEELKQRYALPNRYIVYVGTLGLRKNLQFLLRSYAQLKQESPSLPHKLVLVGKPFNGMDQIEALISQLGIQDDVLVTGYVEEWQVPLFYKLADVFVLPTLYEGFTLTTLESMAYGTPVIATDTSSIREGVGNAGLLVPVDDVPALTRAIRSVLTDDRVREQCVDAGKVQAQLFSWDQCAKDTLALYREVSGCGA